MKQRLFTLISLIVLSNALFAQSISPSQTGEYCPNTEIVFTVTLPGTDYNDLPAVAAIGNSLPIITAPVYNKTIIAGNYVFNFKAKFSDYNDNQTFRINFFMPLNNYMGYYDFTYSKIKSFYTQEIEGAPRVSGITAPRCQISNLAINFTNVTYVNSRSSPKLIYGTATQYEYLLPSGWGLNGTTSNGSNWIAGSNSVTVTSDLTSGDGGKIQVRAINSCGSSLIKGPIVPIAISRPAPIPAITGQDYLCSGSTDYTLNGVPSGATVVWSAPYPNEILVQPHPTDQTIAAVTKTGASSFTMVLTATVTDCISTYTISKNVSIGKPTSIGIVSYNNLAYCEDGSAFNILNGTGHYAYEGVLDVGENSGTATHFTWTCEYPGANIIWSDLNNGSVDVAAKVSSGFITLRCAASNSCGSVARSYTFLVGMGCPMIANPQQLAFSVFPNPAKGSITVNLSSSSSVSSSSDLDKSETLIAQSSNKRVMASNSDKIGNNTASVIQQPKIYSIKITDVLGKTRKSIDAKGVPSISIPLSGIPAGNYFLSVFDGKKWSTQKIIVQ